MRVEVAASIGGRTALAPAARASGSAAREGARRRLHRWRARSCAILTMGSAPCCRTRSATLTRAGRRGRRRLADEGRRLIASGTCPQGARAAAGAPVVIFTSAETPRVSGPQAWRAWSCAGRRFAWTLPRCSKRLKALTRHRRAARRRRVRSSTGRAARREPPIDELLLYRQPVPAFRRSGAPRMFQSCRRRWRNLSDRFRLAESRERGTQHRRGRRAARARTGRRRDVQARHRRRHRPHRARERAPA